MRVAHASCFLAEFLAFSYGPRNASAVSPDPHPLIGTVLRGTYEVRGVIDIGGMGVVFEAEHVRLRRNALAWRGPETLLATETQSGSLDNT